MKFWLASKITNQVKVALGLDRCRWRITGGAPVSTELKEFFTSLDMPLFEAYGLSEVGGAAVINRDIGNLKSCGKAFDGVEIKINEPNEDGHGEVSESEMHDTEALYKVKLVGNIRICNHIFPYIF